MFNQQQLQQASATTPAKEEPKPGFSPGPATKPEPSPTKPTIENTDIYYMPENFQKNNQVAGSSTNISVVVILILGIIFLMVLAVGFYLYFIKPELLGGLFGGAKTEQVVNENKTPTETKETEAVIEETTTARPAGSPKNIYLAFRSELELADTVEKYLAVFARYGTKAKQESLAKQKASLEVANGEGNILLSLRNNAASVLDGTENISEDITDTKATLTVSKTDGRNVGTVIFLPEDGQWKVSEEVWLENEPSSGEETVEPTTAQDDDSDGLSNAEELVLGSNVNSSDSDGDKFKDLEEFNNNYNPAGSGKLSNNTNLGSYLNTTFNFSLLYPVKWDRTIALTDDSVMFTAPNKQFMQILVQPNSSQAEIVEWYQATFNVTNIPNEQLVISESWDGVKAPNGLTIYLTNKDKSYIFVVTYNLGTLNTLEYKNILDMMLRSLKLGV